MMSWAKEPYKIFVGFDGSESIAFDVCAKSILRRAKSRVEIYPLRQEWLRALGLYNRPRDPLASTEFSFTRFLTPTLAGFNGPALFVDADFVFLADIAELFALYDPYYAIQCVQHVYTPLATTKMGGLPQTQYERKNWSSIFLMNCGHPIVKSNLTPYEVNRRSGKWLHRLEWTSDTFIGSLPIEWNCIINHNDDIVPRAKAVHFSEGIRACHGTTSQFDHLWDAEAAA